MKWTLVLQFSLFWVLFVQNLSLSYCNRCSSIFSVTQRCLTALQSQKYLHHHPKQSNIIHFKTNSNNNILSSHNNAKRTILASLRGGNVLNNGDTNNTFSETTTHENKNSEWDIPAQPSIYLSTLSKLHKPPRRGIILVDGFCPYHGQYIAQMAKEAYNAGVVLALSTYTTRYLYHVEQSTDHLSARIPDGIAISKTSKYDYDKLENDFNSQNIQTWVQQIPFDIVGIICESDSGLDETEKLGVCMGLDPSRHNGYNAARRNKFLMNECIAKAGLRTIRQKLSSSLEDAIQFAKELGVSQKQMKLDNDDFFEKTIQSTLVGGDNHTPGESNVGTLGGARNTPTTLSSDGKYCIVKPFRGVASDDVYFCSTIDDVQNAFHKIYKSAVFGSTDGEKCDSVLIQEFAHGTEYAVDTVSKNGHHKIAALWRYDKRSVNGAPFVYFATELIDANTDVGKNIYDYVKKTLDSLDIKWGLTHTEVIVDDLGPRLVEVNCRQHNTDFVPLTSACIGYNALDMLLAAYLGDSSDLSSESSHLRVDWDEIPDIPTPKVYGAIVHLVSFVEGVITNINYDILLAMESLPSVRVMEIYPHLSEGNKISKTINIKSDTGWAHIINDDKEQFLYDYNEITEMMPHMFEVVGTDDA